MFKNMYLRLGVILFLLWLVICTIGPVISTYDPWDMSFDPLTEPTRNHILGTNDCGQDIFSELLVSIRNSFIFGFIAGTSSLILGVILGIAAAWSGGYVDLVLMRIADIILTIPLILLLLLISAITRPPSYVLAIILGAVSWPSIARVIRSQALTLNHKLYIKAVNHMRAGFWYILFRHYIPAIFPLLIVGFANKTRKAVFIEVSLSFLGLLDPCHKSLGIMINYALKYYYLDNWWNWLFPPLLSLSVIILSVTFLAIGAERIFDPRLNTAKC